MSAVSVERYDDFTGGLNLRADQFQLARNESPDMLNVEIDPRGGLFSRGAMREINSTAISHTGSWNPEKLYNFSGDTLTIMLTASNKVYKSTGANFSTLQYSSGNDIVSTSSHGACLAQWGKTMYMSVGTAGSGGYKWLTANTYATALTASGTNPNDWQAYNSPIGGKMPTAEHLLVHANKMFAAHTTENAVAYPNRVRWSHEGLPEDWLESDYIDFEGGGSGITGMATVAGQLVVFKPRAMYVVYGYESADFQIVELSSTIGVSSHHHMAVAETGVYFYVHPKGIYYYNGTSIVDLSENIRSIFPLGQINDSQLDKVSVSYMNRRVWIALPYSTTTSATNLTTNLVYDPTIRDGAWIKHSTADDVAVVGGTDFTNSNGTSIAIAIHATLPRVLRVDMYEQETDLIASVESNFITYYRTGWVDGRSYSMKKMWRRPDIVVKQTDTARQINVKVFHNFEEAVGNERKTFNIQLEASAAGMLWGEGYWGVGVWGVEAAGAQVVRGSNLGLARCVQLLFTGPVGLFWGIDSIAYKFNTRKVTG
jgi:hypothetical protein